MAIRAGTTLGPYEVISPLGAGGMGEVYRARDTRLDRDVAIKVLPGHLSANEESRTRFEREAKAVAALSHPNILAVYDVGQQDGTSYVVTELLEGETLRQTLVGGTVPRRKAMEIAIAVADGLAATHARGVVHRDLKPENIFLTTDGVVKILDFGLARVETAGAQAQDAAHTPTVTINTTPGTVMGTINYMSPEQIRALRADARSDVFSFGCVLYEMLTGQKAFVGETSADTITAILREPPKNIRSVRNDVGPELERVIDRCLEKKPESRFQSSQDLAFTLRSILADSGSASSREVRKPVRRIGLLVGLVGAAIVVGGYFLVRNELRKDRFEKREAIDSIAVLPWENVSRDPEQEYFVDGMTEALISDLAKIGGLKVISRTSVMRYKATTKSLPEVAKELNVDAVVEGSVLRVGDRVRITAQLIHAATDEHLWSESYDRDLRDVLRLQSEVARTIAQEIKVTLTPQEQARMVAARPINPEAFQAYSKGRFHWNKRTPDGFKKAIESFEQAIALAPDWPLAYAGLADTYVVMPGYSAMSTSEAMPKARTAAVKALEMDDSLGEAHATMANIAHHSGWDWPAAEREYKRALALSPNYATGHQWYAEHLLYMGRHDEAIKEMTKAQELDPLSFIIGTNAGWVHYIAGDLEQAEKRLRKTLELGPDFAYAHSLLAETLFLQGKSAEAVKEAREAVRFSNNDPQYLATLGFVYASAGQYEEARRILDELATRSTETYVALSLFALVHAGLGETDQMFERLQRAYQERDETFMFTLIDPLLAKFRSDPRFADLVRRVGLPPLPAPRGSDPPLSPLIKGEDRAASPIAKGGPRGVPDGKIMLAVLPFENLSRDPEQEFFSDGLTEEMISQLGRINPQKLGVIARSSAMHYKNTNRTIEQVGRELGVDYVVEGSVRRAGNRVRITATLILCSDQSQLWGDSFERELEDVLALQNEVAQAIAREIKVTLTPQEQARIVKARPVNPEAHQAYLKGRFHWNKRTPDGFKKAVEFFEQAITLAPDWPLAYAGLADAYAVMPLFASMRPSEVIPKARAAASRALELDESLGEAHASMAIIASRYDWNWPVAEREYERSIALSPNYATAHQWYAEYLKTMGRHGDAIREITKAQELDPLSLVIGTVVGAVHCHAGDFAQAESRLRKTLELGPDFADAHKNVAKTLFLQRRFSEAITEAREAVRLSNNVPWYIATLGYLCAKAGQTEEARRILDELAARSTDAYVAPTHFALVHAGLDERDRMFEWLEKAYQERDVLLLLTLTDPFLGPMRTDSRFVDLVRRVSLPPLPVLRGTEPSASTLSKRGQRGVPDGKIMLAVLPFENLSRDPEQEFFSDGLTEEMITQLGRLNPQKLGVIARSSAMHYKNTDRTIEQVSRELGVDYVVEGSVRRAGNRVRITATLILCSDQSQLWGDSFERELEDVLALQSEVAQAIAREIKVTLSPQEQARMVEARPVNADAHQAYLKGRFHWNKRTPDGLKKAAEYFEQAVSLDPAWPLAYAGLADAYVLMPEYSCMRPSEAIPKARAGAAKALEMDETLGEAHATMGIIANDYDWDWTTAEREFQRALALSPNYATAHQWYAEYLKTMGRHGDAIREITKAQELDPVSLIIGTVAGRIQFYAGNLEQAENRLRKTLELGPDFALARDELVATLSLQGRLAEAITEAREAVRLSNNDPSYAATLGCVCAKAGQPEEARRILDEFAARSKEAYVAPTLFALVHAGLEERDRMFEWLELAYQERDSYLLYTLPGPHLAHMRSDPRFADLVRRVGLPPLPAPRGSDPPVSPLGKGGGGKIMLAVLPFANDSGDKELDYLSDGVAETLINGFSRLDGLSTVPRSTAFRHKGDDADPVQVGRQLSATAVLTGRVLKRGDNLTIQAELVDVVEGRQLWGERYQRKFADLIEIERDIAGEITDALRLRLTGEEKRKISRGYSENAEAYRLYLQGRFWWNKRTKEGFDNALRLLGQAIELDATFALAYSGIADTYSLMPLYGYLTPLEALAQAQAAADRALQLDDQLAEAHTSMGMVRMYLTWNFNDSEKDFKHAMQLNPRYPTAHQWYALCVGSRGRLVEARTELRRAIELDPLAPIFTHNLSWISGWEHDWPQTLSTANAGLEFAPEFPWLHQGAGIALLELDRADESLAHLRKTVELAPSASYAFAYLGYGLARTGHQQEARALLAERLEMAKAHYVPPTDIATIYVGLGEFDEAFRWLEKGYEVRDTWMMFIGVVTQWDPLRDDPRFVDLLRRVGLPNLRAEGAPADSSNLRPTP